MAGALFEGVRLGEAERQPFEPEMALIPAGPFLMGSDSSKDKRAYNDEQPQHEVTLPTYWIDQTEVTNAQYRRCVEAGACRPPISRS